jgi:hypothetical protein
VNPYSAAPRLFGLCAWQFLRNEFGYVSLGLSDLGEPEETLAGFAESYSRGLETLGITRLSEYY